ncbi:MAG: hypothetical protein ACI9BH_001062 [Paracoccaceae bacterium]|jgi:hypothetical protein
MREKMKITRAIVLIGLGLSVSAYASVDIPTRNTPFEKRAFW